MSRKRATATAASSEPVPSRWWPQPCPLPDSLAGSGCRAATPDSWLSPARESYSPRMAITGPPVPYSAENAVGIPATCRWMVKPARWATCIWAAIELCSFQRSSGLSQIWSLSAVNSSPRSSTALEISSSTDMCRSPFLSGRGRQQAAALIGDRGEVDDGPGERECTVEYGLVTGRGAADGGEFRLVVDRARGVQAECGVDGGDDLRDVAHVGGPAAHPGGQVGESTAERLGVGLVKGVHAGIGRQALVGGRPRAYRQPAPGGQRSGLEAALDARACLMDQLVGFAADVEAAGRVTGHDVRRLAAVGHDPVDLDASREMLAQQADGDLGDGEGFRGVAAELRGAAGMGGLAGVLDDEVVDGHGRQADHVHG